MPVGTELSSSESDKSSSSTSDACTRSGTFALILSLVLLLLVQDWRERPSVVGLGEYSG
jgi:hypothetical protein